MTKKEEKVTEGEIVSDKIVKRSDGRLIAGVLLVLLGGLIFLNNFYPAIEVGKYFLPVILMVLGLILIIRSF